MSLRDQGLDEAQPEWQGQRPSGTQPPESGGGGEDLERLRKAVVDSATDARRAFIIFATFSLYLIITVGATTDYQLLTGTVFRLPILAVDIPILTFYVILPLLYLVAHFNLLGEINALSDDVHRLKRYLRQTGLRLEAPIPFGLARTLVQPDDTALPRGLICYLAFIAIVLTPPLVLLQIQFRFLPYHDQIVTWLHRGMILSDVLLVLSLWFAFRFEELRRIANTERGHLSRIHAGFDQMRRTTRKVYWACRHTFDGPICAAFFGILLFFSFVVATVPRGWMEDRALNYFGWLGKIELGPNRDPSYLGHHFQESREMLTLTYYVFERHASWHWLRRSLVLPHSDLVVRRPPDNFLLTYGEDMARLQEIWDQGARGIDLRGRDLRFADFSYSDLRKADLRGADLEGAKLFAADLQFANLGDTERARIGNCPSGDPFHNVQKIIKKERRHYCRTNLQGADLRRADLRSSRLWEADLRQADLTRADLQRADVNHAHLKGADMSWVNLTSAHISHQHACNAFWRGARFQEKAADGTDEANIQHKKMLRTTCILFFDF